jgi:hypothetical protein
MHADQFGHMLRHVATQGGDVTPFRYGHIASYDPTQHRVRCIIPSMTDQDGTPLLSPWMPMGTLSAGSGYGVQVIYAGGATVENPTAGEQVLIAFFDKQRGVAAVPCLFHNTTAKPPATDLPTTADGYSAGADAAVPGDIIIAAPPATAGGANSFVRIRQSGQIQIWSAGQVSADIVGGLTATVNTGDATVTVLKGSATLSAAQGTVNIVGSAIRLSKAIGDQLLQLCNSAFWNNFNIHHHGNGAGPTPPADQTMLTQVLTAE